MSFRQSFHSFSDWFLVFAFFSFLVYVSVSVYLGGTALDGEAFGGKYYIGFSGEKLEVSRLVYRYSLIHGSTAIFSWVVVMVLFAVQSKFPNRRARRHSQAFMYSLLLVSLLFSVLVLALIWLSL